MARIVKFSNEELMAKSVDFIKKYGYSKLTVREIANFVGCSTQPIFKNYLNFEEFKDDLRVHLKKDFELFLNDYLYKFDYLFTLSYAYVLYAKNESNAFSFLFMVDLSNSMNINEVLSLDSNMEIINSISKQYFLTFEKSKRFYRDIMFYIHGLACQVACNNIVVTEKEIKKLISNMIINLRETIK